MKSYTKLERELIDRLRDLETRVSVLEQIPTPIIWAVSDHWPELKKADMTPPSEAEH